MSTISDLTYKIVTYNDTPQVADEWVEWAFEMMELGYDTPSLIMLAGLTQPTTYYLAIDYLKAAIEELNLEIKSGEEAILSCCCYHITKIAQGVALRYSLASVHNFNQELGLVPILMDFSALNWAWGDLDFGEEYQNYWEGVTLKNIEETAIATAKEWLENNKQLYIQPNIIAPGS